MTIVCACTMHQLLDSCLGLQPYRPALAAGTACPTTSILIQCTAAEPAQTHTQVMQTMQLCQRNNSATALAAARAQQELRKFLRWARASSPVSNWNNIYINGSLARFDTLPHLTFRSAQSSAQLTGIVRTGKVRPCIAAAGQRTQLLVSCHQRHTSLQPTATISTPVLSQELQKLFVYMCRHCGTDVR